MRDDSEAFTPAEEPRPRWHYFFFLLTGCNLLAIGLCLLLGAWHAALPGHGKTLMAAYMVGSRGTPKDAVLIGTTVTFSHTAGVLVLGALFGSWYLAPLITATPSHADSWLAWGLMLLCSSALVAGAAFSVVDEDCG